MIVVDASVIAELLLGHPRERSIRPVLAAHAELHVPEHFHAEVLSVLRRFSLRGELLELRAARTLATLVALRTRTYPVRELIAPIWELRSNLSVYDAAYLALARRLDIGLVTLDGALATAAAAEGRLVAV
jgi:predicted nucleic acid-binding protein